MHCNEIKGRFIKRKKKEKKIYAPGIEQATSANRDKRRGMRSEGTWHLTCLERSKTVHTFRNLVDCNKIKERFIERKKKQKKNFAPGIQSATSANIDKRWGMGSEGTLHPVCVERSKTVQTFRKLVDSNKVKGRLIKYKKKEKKFLRT